MSIDEEKENIFKIFKYLKSIRTGHYIPKSNIYIHYKPEIRLIDKSIRNICAPKIQHRLIKKYIKKIHIPVSQRALMKIIFKKILIKIEHLIEIEELLIVPATYCTKFWNQDKSKYVNSYSFSLSPLIFLCFLSLKIFFLGCYQ